MRARVSDELRRRCISLLEDEAARICKVAQNWKELEKNGARLENIEGRQVASASEMATKYEAQEKELRRLIANMGG